MGAVWRARDLRSERSVALKVLLSATDEQDRFAREAGLLAQLRHPGIVGHVAHGRLEDGELYLVMEWLEGQDLEQRLQSGPLSLEESLVVAEQCARALHAAHALGVVHRDVKPSNVYLVGDRVERAKLLDFGVARVLGGAQVVTATGVAIGTPAYMAPEQAKAERSLDHRADVHALGVLLFVCLTGRRPFVAATPMAVLLKVLLEEPPPPSELSPEVPAELDTLVGEMLAKDPAARPASALAVAERLQALRERGTQSALPAPRERRIAADEERILSVVVAREVTPGAQDPALLSTVIVRADATLHEPAPMHALTALLAPLGARVERLRDGGLVAVLAGSGVASDQAFRAARCAHLLKRHLGEIPVSVATGHGRTGGRAPVGEVIDRAVAALSVERGSTQAIRLDALTAELVEARFEVERGPSGVLLGPARSEALFRPRQLLGRATPCVGRRRELGMLVAAYESCVEDEVAQLMVVRAGAGAGKSRLRQHFMEHLIASGDELQSWLAAGDLQRADVPLGMLAAALGDETEATLAQRREALQARVQRAAPEEEQWRLSWLLCQLIGAPFELEPDSAEALLAADPARLASATERACLDLLAAELELGPVLLVLEDLHWGDLPTVRLVDAALRDNRTRPLMVLALAREEVQQRFPGLWSDRNPVHIELPPLPAKACGRLARQVLGSEIGKPVIDQIVRRSGGNAFYLEELIRAVDAGHGEGLPQTVLAMAQSRLERFGPQLRLVLRVASVFGETFWREGLSELLPAGFDAQLQELLAELMAREVVERSVAFRFGGAEQWVFRHALVREAAYAMLTEEDRVLGHRLAAQWLEGVGERAAVLGEHWARGAVPEQAAHCFARAADESAKAGDAERALTFSERAVACGISGEALGEVRALQAEAHVTNRQMQAASERAREATQLLPPENAQWAACTGMSVWLSGITNHPEETIRASQALMAYQPSLATTASAIRGCGWVVRIFTLGGQFDWAEAFLARGHELMSREGLGALDAHTRGWLAFSEALQVLHANGDAWRAVGLWRSAYEGYVADDDVYRASMLRAELGIGLTALGEYAQAAEHGLAAAETARRSGNSFAHSYARLRTGAALMGLGQHREALTLMSEVAESFHGFMASMEHYARVWRLRALWALGRLEEAEAEARWCEAQTYVGHHRKIELRVFHSDLLAAQGHHQAALGSAQRALRTIQRLGEARVSVWEPLVWRAVVEAQRALGDPEAAASARRGHARLMRQAGLIPDEAARRHFLEAVPHNRRLVQLHHELTGVAD